MQIAKIEFLDKSKLVMTLNVWVLLVNVCLIVGCYYFFELIIKKQFFKSIEISETVIGIGKSSIKIKCDKRVQGIAHKIWIELKTRKIGIMFEEDQDVITEVYDSWYEAFKIIRKQLEEIPEERIGDAKELIDIVLKVLNDGLRPHLTKWQAKYRAWYKKEKEKNQNMTPQEIQKMYPEYQELVSDLKKTNEIMINFSKELRKIIDK
mgnify:CR=1 FL=1